VESSRGRRSLEEDDHSEGKAENQGTEKHSTGNPAKRLATKTKNCLTNPAKLLARKTKKDT
jgi:hypothetical protein